MSERQHTSQPGKRPEATHEGDGLFGEETRQTSTVPGAGSAERRQTAQHLEAQSAATTATRPAPSPPPPAPLRQRRQAKRQAQPASRRSAASIRRTREPRPCRARRRGTHAHVPYSAPTATCTQASRRQKGAAPQQAGLGR